MSASPFHKLQYPICTDWFLTVYCGLKFNTYINDHRLASATPYDEDYLSKRHVIVNFQTGNNVCAVVFDDQNAAIHFCKLNKDKIFVRGIRMLTPIFHKGFINYFVREVMI